MISGLEGLSPILELRRFASSSPSPLSVALLDSTTPHSQPPASPSSVPALHIDWDHLHQLSDSDPEFELQLLTLFVDDTGLRLPSLSTAIAHQSFLEIEQLAHYIKGASANVGVRNIYRHAEQLEADARHHRSTELETHYDAIATYTHALQTWVKQQPPAHFPD
jgi:HPt (histidine-containing phosphotransfer) domain-containing protein